MPTMAVGVSSVVLIVVPQTLHRWLFILMQKRGRRASVLGIVTQMGLVYYESCAVKIPPL